MNRCLLILLVSLPLLFTPALYAAANDAENDAQRKPIVTTDLLRVRTATHIDVSRDGSFAVVAVHSIASKGNDEVSDADREYEYRSHLYRLNVAEPNQRPVQLTHGRRTDRDPQISPDGQFIAFVRAVEKDNGENRTSQVWILPVDGGEARQVTALEHGASHPRWSPNSRQLVFSSSIPMGDLDGSPPWPSERPQRDWSDVALDDSEQPRPDGSRSEIRAWLEANANDANPNVITRLNFQDEQRLRHEMTFRHLHVVDLSASVEPGEPRRITDGFFDYENAVYMPNGREIVCVANRQTDEHPDRTRTNSLWLVSIEGEYEPRQLLESNDRRFRQPQPSHDGNVIAFLAQKQDEPAFRQWQLGIASRNENGLADPIWLTDEETFDASVRSFQWHPRRAALYFNAAREGGFPLLTISPGLLKPAPVIENDNGMRLGVHAFAVGGDAIVYARTTPANPSTVRVRDSQGTRLAFDLNNWVYDRELSMPREAWLTRDDGTRVHYWIMEPTNRATGETYPLALQIHGGPSAMWGPGERSMWHEFQLLTSWGYGVVYANPRGSGGYGYEFQSANFQDWGEGPMRDVLAAVDNAAKLDWVDPERLVVTGGSYAGYLTAWIIAHDHRFKAAVAQRGVYHLPTFFGEGNAWQLLEWAMGGRPYENDARDVMEHESPFNYAYDIRTPLLIMHASEDLRTGVSQSEMLYRALKTLERPVEYVRYPGAGHDLSRTGDPRQRLDRLNRIIEFFERHIDNSRPAPTLDKRSHAHTSSAEDVADDTPDHAVPEPEELEHDEQDIPSDNGG